MMVSWVRFHKQVLGICLAVGVLGGMSLAHVSLAEPVETSATQQSVNPVEHTGKALHVVAPGDAKPMAARMAETLTLSFRQRFQAVLDNAKEYLGSQDPGNGVVVVDVDETILDNRAYYIEQGGWDPDTWSVWETKMEASVLDPTLDFLQWVELQGFEVYFVTGRREGHRMYTTRNLQRAGVPAYAGLFLKPDDYPQEKSPDAYKIEARKTIEELTGMPVVMVLGDQPSDMRGDAVGKGFLLPNPIYFIP